METVGKRKFLVSTGIQGMDIINFNGVGYAGWTLVELEPSKVEAYRETVKIKNDLERMIQREMLLAGNIMKQGE